MKKNIVVIEDDLDIAQSIRYNLEREGGFQVRIASTGETGLRSVLEHPPSLIILDINLPLMNGFEICRRLRREETTSQIPIIMLTARMDETDKVHGLSLGADDYITKPFSVRELIARVYAVLRRSEGESTAPVYDDGTLFIDYAHFIVRCGGQEVNLTRKEFGLLKLLAQSKGRVLTREYLLDRVWGIDYDGETRTLDVHIRRLRQKLGIEGYIETAVGIGYRFVEVRKPIVAAT
ncbi:MAG TPA: response regulator transcription factor [Acidobacteriota bacterium]|nr:response regulator transcription factor [Acidobacteriota bacterium]HNC43113.1 response regulator transcription factor [Acidobacteriota bacterium]HND18788.1 response regulator transcription factor [Acidobacteriota bacterium]HNG94888.1 response regulator transcription factor [Acidobacteriota bacterium]HNH83061.1 response regulator transcription factor [Acidobacteriota bacterium]